MDPILEAWGIEISKEILMDERSQVISVASGARLGPFALSVPIESPIHIEVGQDQMNLELGMVSQLPPIFYLWGSALELNEARLKEKEIEVTPLFHSSRRSWKIPRERFAGFSLEFALPPKEGNFPLGVLARGTFPDPFEGQTVPDWPEETSPFGEEPEKEEKPEPVVSDLTPAPGQLILIGCDEMFKEKTVESGGQLILFLNAIDTLISGGKLVAIRNRQQAMRTFSPPPPAQKAWCRFLVLGLMPILVAGMSISYAMWRRRLREAYASLS